MMPKARSRISGRLGAFFGHSDPRRGVLIARARAGLLQVSCSSEYLFPLHQFVDPLLDFGLLCVCQVHRQHELPIARDVRLPTIVKERIQA
eukprot:5747991-Prymnesium_polylepis.1